MILIGTKCDDISSRIVSYEDGENLARDNNMKFFETSSKNGHCVEEAFTEIAHMVIDERNKPKEQKKDDKKTDLTKKQKIQPVRSWCLIV
jgi:GTPase SAR1 family protein